jgi:hypothetical protein
LTAAAYAAARSGATLMRRGSCSDAPPPPPQARSGRERRRPAFGRDAYSFVHLDEEPRRCLAISWCGRASRYSTTPARSGYAAAAGPAAGGLIRGPKLPITGFGPHRLSEARAGAVGAGLLAVAIAGVVALESGRAPVAVLPFSDVPAGPINGFGGGPTASPSIATPEGTSAPSSPSGSSVPVDGGSPAASRPRGSAPTATPRLTGAPTLVPTPAPTAVPTVTPRPTPPVPIPSPTARPTPPPSPGRTPAPHPTRSPPVP